MANRDSRLLSRCWTWATCESLPHPWNPIVRGRGRQREGRKLGGWATQPGAPLMLPGLAGLMLSGWSETKLEGRT